MARMGTIYALQLLHWAIGGMASGWTELCRGGSRGVYVVLHTVKNPSRVDLMGTTWAWRTTWGPCGFLDGYGSWSAQTVWHHWDRG